MLRKDGDSLEFLKLLLSIILLAPFVDKADSNFMFIGIAILLCGFIAHSNNK